MGLHWRLLAITAFAAHGLGSTFSMGQPKVRALERASTTGTRDDTNVPRLVVLGSAQDGGVPHAACSCVRCEHARRDPSFRRRGPSLGLVVPGAKPWLIDASPDFPEQLASLAPDGEGAVDRSPLGGLFLTHAHIGHYAGLVHLGREVVAAHELPVYTTPAMARFLETNAPWEQLVQLGHVVLRPVEPGIPVAVGGGIDVTSMRVPHRDEYADTVGYRIEGPDVTVLYVPDTDRWETWDPPLESRLEGVDVVLLDGTFHGPGELPGRAIEDVPHPPMTVTMDRLQSRVDAGLRVVFTHLNHSNPAVDPSSEAARACRARGFEIARDGDETPLALPGGRRPPPRLSRRVDDSLALDDGARGALLPRGPGLHRRRLGLPSGAG